MKRNVILTIASVLSILFMTLHLTSDTIHAKVGTAKAGGSTLVAGPDHDNMADYITDLPPHPPNGTTRATFSSRREPLVTRGTFRLRQGEDS
jgi:hypothetical protein